MNLKCKNFSSNKKKILLVIVLLMLALISTIQIEFFASADTNKTEENLSD